jgi:hypothetical protein
LRRQVEAYVKYTRRIPMLQEFVPGADETKLYNYVSEFLQRPSLYALPNSQRQLITLVLRKLLASSTFAIAGALETLIKRLGQTLDEKAASTDLAEELDQDYEALDELADEIEGCRQPMTAPRYQPQPKSPPSGPKSANSNRSAIWRFPSRRTPRARHCCKPSTLRSKNWTNSAQPRRPSSSPSPAAHRTTC